MTSSQLYTPAKLTPLSKWRRVLILILSFVAMMALTVMLASVTTLVVASPRGQVLTTTALQNIVGFMGAALIAARFISLDPLRWLGLKTLPGFVSCALALLVIPALLPAMNAVVNWNDSITFSGALYEKLRMWEDDAAALTDTFLATDTVGGLLVNILLVGVLTGIGEELLFRGALQRTLSSIGLGEHLAVWTAAFIFSFMHFQFFGFVPRLLLGAVFGYIYIWSGSIWVGATLHAINNSIVVVADWFTARGSDLSLLENLGVGECYPWTGPLSVVVTIIVLYLFRKSIVLK